MLREGRGRKFLREHPRIAGGVAAAIVVVFAARWLLVGFASTADFYPSSCLGNWDNVQNALGKPSVAPGSPASAFTVLNSAVFSTGTAQMFCGNFAGDTDITMLQAKTFQSATLVLSWSVAVPAASAGAAAGGRAADGAIAVSAATSTDGASGTVLTSPSSSAEASSTPVIPATTGTTTTTTTTETGTAKSTPLAPTSSVATSTGATGTASGSPAVSSPPRQTSSAIASSSAPATTTAPTPAPAPTPASSGVSTAPAAAPAPAPVSAPARQSVPAAGTASTSTAWLFRWLPVAFADEATSVAPAPVAADVPSGAGGSSSGTTITAASGTAAADAALTAEPTVASSGVEGTPSTSTPSAPITVNTSLFQNIALPSSTQGDFLGIIISTDGVTWQPLLNINQGNWQSGRYSLPIRSWSELEHLQVAFVGLGAANAPKIFLDSVGVEVSYADMANGDTVASSTAAASSTNQTRIVGEPTSTAVGALAANAPDPLAAIYDPAAEQHCSVAPFSNIAARGGSASYLLALAPPPPATSTATATASRSSPPASPAAAAAPPLFDVSLGGLPEGVTGHIVTGMTPGMDTIGIMAAPTTVPGSYTAIAVYKERQRDGKILPNYCQFNLIIH